MKELFRAIHFWLVVGHWPVQDDLERVYCDDAGKIGHSDCGWCAKRNKPNFMVHPDQRH